MTWSGLFSQTPDTEDIIQHYTRLRLSLTCKLLDCPFKLTYKDQYNSALLLNILLGTIGVKILMNFWLFTTWKTVSTSIFFLFTLTHICTDTHIVALVFSQLLFLRWIVYNKNSRKVSSSTVLLKSDYKEPEFLPTPLMIRTWWRHENSQDNLRT